MVEKGENTTDKLFIEKLFVTWAWENKIADCMIIACKSFCNENTAWFVNDKSNQYFLDKVRQSWLSFKRTISPFPHSTKLSSMGLCSGLTLCFSSVILLLLLLLWMLLLLLWLLLLLLPLLIPLLLITTTTATSIITTTTTTTTTGLLI